MLASISCQPYCVGVCGLQSNPNLSNSPLTASQYIMEILGVTLKSCAAEPCRAVQQR